MDTGCPSKFNWCHTTPQIWLPQFLLGAFLFAIGYSSCISLLVSLYTKIVAAKNQVSYKFYYLQIEACDKLTIDNGLKSV